MKQLAAVLLLISGVASADSWGPDLIKFSLENGPKLETMIWISGYSYSATAFYHRYGCLPKNNLIESKYLIEVLNKKHAGKTITSEQASETLDSALSASYGCNSYNSSSHSLLLTGTLCRVAASRPLAKR
jgi:hypothetical protein